MVDYNKSTDRFLEIFYEISQIPRQSGKEEKIADYLEEFAKENSLECYRDKANNILIKKQGNKANNETLILQAHMDMVCVKKEESTHNFDKDPIEIVINEDVITAKDTSLGADQGIGMAIMLVILESEEIKHPDLECLFTTEEETTFNGAVSFDYSQLKGRKLINLDHCRDDSIVIGSDADICNKYTLNGTLQDNNLPAYEIKISGIEGGNSGNYIERSNKNAITLMAEIIKRLQKDNDIFICNIDGGETENDIAISCRSTIKTEINDLKNKIEKMKKYANIEVSKIKMDMAFNLEDSRKIVNEIIDLKQGIIKKINDENIVSGNIGTVRTQGNEVIITGILRCINMDELEKCNKENMLISEKNNFLTEKVYDDRAWIPKNSKLKEDYSNSYHEINGEYPEFVINHGGLECSCINWRMKNIDVISIGANIENFHTVDERTYISSCEKILETLIGFLQIK